MAPKSALKAAPTTATKTREKQKETADTDHPMGDNEQPAQPVEVSKTQTRTWTIDKPGPTATKAAGKVERRYRRRYRRKLFFRT